MAEETRPTDPLTGLLAMQGEALRELWATSPLATGGVGVAPPTPQWGEIGEWAQTGQKLQGMWLEFLAEKARDSASSPVAFDPAQFMLMSQGWVKAAQDGLAAQAQLAQDSMKLWQGVAQSALGGENSPPDLP